MEQKQDNLRMRVRQCRWRAIVVCVLTAYSVLGSFSWIANAAAPVPDGLRFSGRVEMDYFNNEGGVHWQKTNHFTMDVGKGLSIHR
jgi:hypothetical protein